MPAPAPPTEAADVTPRLERVFDLRVALLPEVVHGRTPLGLRTRAPITGGRVSGPRLEGEVLGGGSDWQLLRADGWLELRAEYDLRVNDGTLVHVRNHGLWHSPSGDWPAHYAWSTPRFEAPLGPHAWLNQAVFVADVRPWTQQGLGVELQVWRVQGPEEQPI
jgi:Protein of unknown function (DUF3237)